MSDLTKLFEELQLTADPSVPVKGVLISDDPSAEPGYIYTDSADGESDRISIQVNNVDGKWTSAWMPTKGSVIVPTMRFDGRSLACGAERNRSDMKKAIIFCMLMAAAIISVLSAATAENGEAPGIRDMVMEETKAFSFRNGVSWGMNPQQVETIEDVAMQKRTSSDWSVMVTAEPVTVSRFTADLVYMFYQDALRMITYEFRTDCSMLNYQYLTGALCSVYGESREADPAVIKGWMDRIYQNYYRQELIHQAVEWTSEDGTKIFLYYYTEQNYAILYICPVSNGSGGSYDTNGL